MLRVEVGDMVVLRDVSYSSQIYPRAGIRGIVVKFYLDDPELGTILVQWEQGSTGVNYSGHRGMDGIPDRWYTSTDTVEVIR